MIEIMKNIPYGFGEHDYNMPPFESDQPEEPVPLPQDVKTIGAGLAKPIEELRAELDKARHLNEAQQEGLLKQEANRQRLEQQLEQAQRERDAAVERSTELFQLNVDSCEERDGLVGALADWRYSHDEIEASCGGEIALEVRAKVTARRAQIQQATPKLKGESK